jgi:hypothetical protein
MAQTVNRRPLTAEALFRAPVSPCGICGTQNGTGAGFCQSCSVFPCQYNSTVILHTHIIWGINNSSVGSRSSERWSHSIDMNNKKSKLGTVTKR